MAVIKLKLNDACTRDLGLPSMLLLFPPTKMTANPDPNGFGYSVVTPQMDLDHVHTVEVGDVAYHAPKIRPEWASNTTFVDAINLSAINDTIKRRKECDALRLRLVHYVKSGAITVVEDDSDFLSSDYVTDEETAVATTQAKSDG